MRDFDQALNSLKQEEVQLMKKASSAANIIAAEKGKYRPECTRYAKFYLEQLFNYLVLALQNNPSNGS